jgi:hypothetical protein
LFEENFLQLRTEISSRNWQSFERNFIGDLNGHIYKPDGEIGLSRRT